ncbi:MAG: PIN domain-containing protein [Gammaproteobacteria bacterium]|nr:PIN domain-containing protein [Gammaproteobacteria bacterium]
MKIWLLDTGPIIAYLDPRDPFHAPVTQQLGQFSGRLCTTSAVITEAMHFVAPSRNGPELLAGFAATANLETYDLSQSAALTEAALLMQKYRDTPMDYADATLLLLAEHLEIKSIATLDRRGFSAYRTRQGKPLRQVLQLS